MCRLFLLNLQSVTFLCDRLIEIQNKMTRAVLSRALGGLVFSDMTCYSVVHLNHFYVSKSLHSYVGGVRNTADLILIEG